MNYFDIYSFLWVTKTFVSIVRGPKITTKGNLAVTTWRQTLNLLVCAWVWGCRVCLCVWGGWWV